MPLVQWIPWCAWNMVCGGKHYLKKEWTIQWLWWSSCNHSSIHICAVKGIPWWTSTWYGIHLLQLWIFFVRGEIWNPSAIPSDVGKEIEQFFLLPGHRENDHGIFDTTMNKASSPACDFLHTGNFVIVSCEKERIYCKNNAVHWFRQITRCIRWEHVFIDER